MGSITPCLNHDDNPHFAMSETLASARTSPKQHGPTNRIMNSIAKFCNCFLSTPQRHPWVLSYTGIDFPECIAISYQWKAHWIDRSAKYWQCVRVQISNTQTTNIMEFNNQNQRCSDFANHYHCHTFSIPSSYIQSPIYKYIHIMHLQNQVYVLRYCPSTCRFQVTPSAS